MYRDEQGSVHVVLACGTDFRRFYRLASLEGASLEGASLQRSPWSSSSRQEPHFRHPTSQSRSLRHHESC